MKPISRVPKPIEVTILPRCDPKQLRLNWVIHEVLEIPFELKFEELCLIQLTEKALKCHGNDMTKLSIAPSDWYSIPGSFALGFRDKSGTYLNGTNCGYRVTKDDDIAQCVPIGMDCSCLQQIADHGKFYREQFPNAGMQYVDTKLHQAIQQTIANMPQ